MGFNSGFKGLMISHLYIGPLRDISDVECSRYCA